MIKVQLKKINLSKSVIQQIEPADVFSIKNIKEVFGWGSWNVGKPTAPNWKKMIVFKNTNDEPRKMIMFERIEDTSKEVMVDMFYSLKGMKKIHEITVYRGSRVTELKYNFEQREHLESFVNDLQKLKRLATEKGQFFI